MKSTEGCRCRYMINLIVHSQYGGLVGSYTLIPTTTDWEFNNKATSLEIVAIDLIVETVALFVSI